MEMNFDYVVVGSGLAGLYSALCAAQHGTVGLVTKADVTDSNSYNAQGGIAAVSGKDDDPEYHFEDTIEAGRGLCDYPAVEILVNEGPALIRDLIEKGMHFDVTESGRLALGLEGGHHRRRILHAGGDATGKFVTSFVLDLVKKEKNIRIIPHCALLGLLVTDNVCDGVRCWNFRESSEYLVYGKDVILASGGAGAIYRRTTNPETTTGDGIAAAYRAGCKIEDMEFIQFHPTALAKEGAPGFLISEAVRGEGAWLLNLAGERFMYGAHELAELAPRDVVAQNIDRQIRKEGKGYVWLSLSHLDPEKIQARFPTICARCREYGIDPCDRIPVAPAAHYTVGGVCCGENGESSVRHLYVCGEIASTGIMGANRLASNSLIECMVFARRVVKDTLERSGESRAARTYAETFRCSTRNEELYAAARAEISGIVSDCAGIVRTVEGLMDGISRVEALERKLLSQTSYDPQEVYCSMASGLIEVARLILRGALFRQESRGCHFRADFPEEREEFRIHTVQQAGHGITGTPVNETSDTRHNRTAGLTLNQ